MCVYIYIGIGLYGCILCSALRVLGISFGSGFSVKGSSYLFRTFRAVAKQLTSVDI